MLEEFWTSKENQKKYGFEYFISESGISSIVYDGNYDKLLDIAFSAIGYKRFDSEASEETLDIVDFGVDGDGDEANFFVQFKDHNNLKIRFNLVAPEYYPADFQCQFAMTNASLSNVNEIMREHNLELIEQWNTLRPDSTIQPDDMVPNYRAINRIKLDNE